MSESKNCAIVALDLRWSPSIIEEREIAQKILVIRPRFGSSLDSWLPLDACFRLHPSILIFPCRPVDWWMPRLPVIDAASLLQAVAVRPGRMWALATKKKNTQGPVVHVPVHLEILIYCDFYQMLFNWC